MFTWIEKLIYKKDLEANRLLVGEITQSKKSSRLLLCLFKGLLIFIAAYCSIAGMLDAFNIPYNKPVLFVSFMFFSMYVALLYLNKVIFYVFYIILFLGYTIALAAYYFIANSGFQSAMNILAKEYSDYFNLPSYRESQIMYSNTSFTVTVASIFLGVFIIILLNVTISGYMNTLETILVTLPFTEIALFIHKSVPGVYIFGLLFVYATITFLQLSRHSRMQVKGRKTHEFLRLKKKKSNSYSYQADTKVFLYSFIISAIISLVIAVSLGSLLKPSDLKVATNEIHRKTQDAVKIFVQSGFTGFLDRYVSSGGLSGGKLGGVSQVRPDFETDLIATYVPYNYKTVYLKGFDAEKYQGDAWYEGKYRPEKMESKREYPFNEKAKINIENLDAGIFTYYPYFSAGQQNVKYLNVAETKYDIYFTPNVEDTYDKEYHDDLLDDKDYYDYVYSSCLEVPDNIKDTLDNTLSEVPEVTDYKTENEYRLKTAEAIYNYYLDNFYYTMAPGTTPRNRDFVEYFLDSQKRGFCAHFASAEVLLLRERGIPARYCEGYIIPLTLVLDDASIADAKFEDYFEGELIGNSEYVVQVPVNDSYAHAWVEIYLDGYGFVPIESTIPSFEDSSSGNAPLIGGFGSLFQALLSNSSSIEDIANTETATQTGVFGNNFFSLFKFNTNAVAGILIRIIFALIIILVLYLIIRWSIIRIRLMIYKKNNDEYHLVMYEYTKLTNKLRRKKYITKKNPLPSDVKLAYERYLYDYYAHHRKTKDIDTNKLFEYYERVMYS